MEKVKGEFYFKIAYHDHKEQIQNATVVLIINYKSKTYSIKPYCGTEHFEFIESSHKWKMWKAITSAINDAIDFANEELNINN